MQVTLPDVGVDVQGTAGAVGSLVGDVFVVVLGVAALLIASEAWFAWMRRADGAAQRKRVQEADARVTAFAASEEARRRSSPQ